MSGDPHDPRYAPPAAHVEDVVAAPGELRLAARSTRFWAAMIDIGLMLLGMWVVARLTPFNTFAGSPGIFELQFKGFFVGISLFLLLHGWLLVRRGQTVGKALLRIRILRPDGSRVSPARVIGLRYGIGYVLEVIPALGHVYALVDALLIFRASRRCLHDAIADTIVVRA